MSETWIPETFQGQVLILAYGENRLYLEEWAAGLEDGSLIEVTGSVKYINDTGQFFITGPLDFSKPEGVDPM